MKTVEEKARAYNKVREKIAVRFGANVAEEIFSEFEESEYEKIRKEIIQSIKGDMIVLHKAKCIAWLEKQGKKESNDKIEPKFKLFKPGDWITNGACTIQITSVNDIFYLHDNDCIGGDIESIDKEYHLWTIGDAKPGDILIDNWRELKYPVIFILKDFKKVNHGLCIPSDYHSFCYLKANDTHTFCVEGWHHKNNIQPANKEQRDLLFSKMREAGYEWDVEKKELKKIEQKQVIDYPDSLPKDNWELIHEFVEKFGRIPGDEDELNALVEYILRRQKVTWSEEDENIFNRIIQKLDESDNVSHYDYADFEMWLIDLKERFGKIEQDGEADEVAAKLDEVINK